MSLRTRVLTALAFIAMLLIGAAIVVTRATHDNLVDRVDAQLDDLAAPDGLPSVFPGSIDLLCRMAAHQPDRAASYFGWQVTPGRDPCLFSRPALVHEDLRFGLTKDVLDRADDGAFTIEAKTPEGEPAGRYRMLVKSIDGSDSAVIVALPLTDVEASMSRLIRLEFIVTLSILAVLGLVGWWVIRLGIRPVKQMTAAASSIGAGNLSERVPAAADGTEAGELGLALNRMLEQIEDAFAKRAQSEDRLRQFVADASHELRTPVATVRGYAELYRAGGLAAPEQLDDAMRRTESEAVRMGKLVDDLLLLARLDQGRPLERAPVELDRIIADVVADARVRDPERSITLDVSPINVIGDAGRLHQAISNLVSNAIVHTPHTSAVVVAGAARDDHAIVTVTDEGPGMTPDVAQRVFERFYRADKARSRAAGGSGLGLSIVDATIRAHGGTVTVASDPAAGTTFTITLPRGLPAPDSPAQPSDAATPPSAPPSGPPSEAPPGRPSAEPTPSARSVAPSSAAPSAAASSPQARALPSSDVPRPADRPT